MARQNIAFIWDHGQSQKGRMPTAKEMEDLIDERRERVTALLRTTPLVSLSPTDFWDSVLLDMIDHYFSAGGSTPYKLADNDMVRRQAEYVIKTRFGTTPRDLLNALDRDARAIVRYVEQGWEDAVWAA